MELFIINTYLSLLIFNPLEAAVLFLAATGDFKLVFSRKFIKHWFILGTINFVFQYTVNLIPIGFLNLFYSYFNSIFIMGVVLFVYFNKVIKNKIKFIKIISSTFFNLISILFILLLFSKNIGLFVIPVNAGINIEFLINFTIKIFQFLLLYIFYKGKKKEKICRKIFKEKC